MLIQPTPTYLKSEIFSTFELILDSVMISTLQTYCISELILCLILKTSRNVSNNTCLQQKEEKQNGHSVSLTTGLVW